MQFCDVKEDPGKKRGDYVYFDKLLRLDTKGGSLTETSTVPTAHWKIVKDSIQVTEWGNKVAWTDKLETLSEFDPSNISAQMLKSDQHEVIDSVIATHFDSGRLTAVCTNTATTTFTSSGTAGATAGVNMSDRNVRDICSYLEKMWVPKYADGNYRCICSVNSRQGLYDYLQAVASYTKPEYIHNSEVGQYYSCRFVVDNYGGSLSDSIGTGSVYGEAFFFGKEAVMEAVAQLEEVRRDTPTDLGRSKSVGWVGIMNWKKVWDLSNDDVNATGKGIERILRVTSQ